ncbi:kelch-like protein 24 [Microplitis demolitor]|uniref:kelch-like protein 24 n=1 Tax=Microplitis demolitor TaxID=69319 RepID=UPI0004CD5F85|nr:kelch-like protein 24 [Microplitis demolitor]
MTALGSVLYKWDRMKFFQSRYWNYSDLFSIEGVDDVAFSIGVRVNNVNFTVCVRKNNLKSAKAVIQIAIHDEEKKKEINNWKDTYIFNYSLSSAKLYFAGNENQFFQFSSSITCRITWYGFNERVLRDNFYQKLQQFHRATEFSDVILSVDGAELPAHKIILSSHSPVLHAMLTSDMREKKESRIDIDNFEIDVINEMLAYFYTGNTKASQDVETALKMLELSNMYQINGLEEICEQTLIKKMKVDNVLIILVAADDFSIQKLVDESIKFMVKNRKEVGKLPEFEELLKHRTGIMCKFIRASFET